MASKLDSNFQLWDVTRDELRQERKPAAEDDSDVYWVFFRTLWHVTFNKALSQYVTSYRYCFNFSFTLSWLQWFKGIQMKLQNEEKSGHWNAKYVFIFSSFSPFSSDDFKQSCIPAWAAGGEAAALVLDRERDCYRNVTHCHLQASQIGKWGGTHTQTPRERVTHASEQASRWTRWERNKLV